MTELSANSQAARALAAALEPVAGQVYFAPECHANYEELGFGPSPAELGGVQMPEMAAYFTSRGSVMGQVPGQVVAAAFGVFKPDIVVPSVVTGWSITDAATIEQARTDGAVAHLRRVLGDSPDGLGPATELLRRATEDLEPAGKPLYAGVSAQSTPDHPVGVMWRLADMIREYRGDAHVAVWTAAGFDACEIGLLTELYWGLPVRSYSRTRGWTEQDYAAAEEGLAERDLIADGTLTERGWAVREAIEVATDDACAPIVAPLEDDLDSLVEILAAWSSSIRAARGYPASGPVELAEAARR